MKEVKYLPKISECLTSYAGMGLMLSLAVITMLLFFFWALFFYKIILIV